jgi:hypothetical protein
MPRISRLLLLVASLTIVLALPASNAFASGTQDAIFQDDLNLMSNPTRTLGTMRELGVTRVRVGLYWSHVAPAGKRKPSHFSTTNPSDSHYNWAIYDQIVRQAKTAGIQVYFLVTGPAPQWATGGGQPSGGPRLQWKPSAKEFGAFVRAAGTRYSGSYKPTGASTAIPKISFWSIWNEPNYGIDLAPQATNHNRVEVSAQQYRGLADNAWKSLQATHHGRDTILIGETAPHGTNSPGNFSGIKPLSWLRALYCVGSSYRPLTGSSARAIGCPTTSSGIRGFAKAHAELFRASGFAAHLYVQGFPPNQLTYLCHNTLCPSRTRSDPDFADLATVNRLMRTLDRLNRAYGSHSQFPIYNTEYGYWTNPPEKAARISPTTAAYYINWAEYISWKSKRIRSYSQYLLVDPPANNFASGLEFKDGTPKVTFDAYMLPIMLPSTNTRRGRSLEVWGAVRPAAFAKKDGFGTQQAQVQFQANSRGGWKTVKRVSITNSRGYFDIRQTFSGSGSVRIAWVNESGQTVTSRTVRISVK